MSDINKTFKQIEWLLIGAIVLQCISAGLLIANDIIGIHDL